MRPKVRALLSGLRTYLPGYDMRGATGGTDTAEYCYSVWLRHLLCAQDAGTERGIPHTVAELGPGDSIGLGLAALLCGAEKYYALDVVRYSDLRTNLAIFDRLVQLFMERAEIPDVRSFPGLKPALARYEFPRDVLDEAHLARTLHPARLADIRASIERADAAGSRIVYQVPWNDPAVIEEASVDAIYSQAVLEHVQDPARVYESMRRWLKPAGWMSHQIDYRCHGKADHWNGHWTYSDRAWRIVVGRRPYLLNRLPHSEHIRLLRAAGFSLLSETLQYECSPLRRDQLARHFRNLSDQDLTTRGAYIVAAPAH
jgi:SAM-dependent methyltransferase